MRFSAEVFAVEDRSLQVVWRGASSRVCIDGRQVDGPDTACGSALIHDLDPSREYELTVAHRDDTVRLRARTLAAPPGAQLARFATISDLHIGERWFGLLPRVFSHSREHHGVRAARVGAAEARAWGADRLILKGDLVDHGTDDQWQMLGELVRDLPLPAELMIGNHEVMKRQHTDPVAQLAKLDCAHEPVRVIDLPGLRTVLVDTTVRRRGYGRINAPADALDAVADAGGACLVILHHHIQLLPLPTFWPPGINSLRGNQFVKALRRANHRVAITTGHSHRHRRRSIHGVEHIEVGSAKDYPGVWAGYAVHEGGLRQVVRRVGDADHLEWTDRTRAVMFGAWRHFSPGRLRDRCFTIDWTAK